MKGGAECGFGEPVILAAPTRGTCPMCAARHAKNAPHVLGSVYYQVRFRQAYGRAPTRADAMMHCEPRPGAATEAQKREAQEHEQSYMD